MKDVASTEITVRLLITQKMKITGAGSLFICLEILLIVRKRIKLDGISTIIRPIRTTWYLKSKCPDQLYTRVIDKSIK